MPSVGSVPRAATVGRGASSATTGKPRRFRGCGSADSDFRDIKYSAMKKSLKPAH